MLKGIASTIGNRSELAGNKFRLEIRRRFLIARRERIWKCQPTEGTGEKHLTALTWCWIHFRKDLGTSSLRDSVNGKSRLPLCSQVRR